MNQVQTLILAAAACFISGCGDSAPQAPTNSSQEPTPRSNGEYCDSPTLPGSLGRILRCAADEVGVYPAPDPATLEDTPQGNVPPLSATGWETLPAGVIVEIHNALETSQLEAASKALFVRYTSRNQDNQPIIASGLVLFPLNSVYPQGETPLVVYGHMTTGAADACAPTHGTAESSELRRMQQGDLVATELLNYGAIVARPDYEGLGEAGPHPYLRGDSLARTMRDMASAVKSEWPEIGSKWAAAGHSEGGVAALNSGNRKHPNANNLELVGIASITPVTQLDALITLLESVPLAAPAVDVAVALAALALSGVASEDKEFKSLLLEEGGLSPRALALWPDIERLCLDDLSDEASWGGLSPLELRGPQGDYALAELKRALTSDDVINLPMRRDVPIRIDAGIADEVALMPLTDNLVKTYRDRGYDVTYETWPATHSPTADMAAPNIAAWLMEKF